MERDTWVFKKILAHRERDDGILDFKLEWEGDCELTWDPCDYVPMEFVSRYLAKVAHRNRSAFKVYPKPSLLSFKLLPT